jgi:protein TonB
MILSAVMLARIRWLVAFLLVAGVHAGLALVAVREAEAPDPDNASGAFVIELAPISETPSPRPDQLPPGPTSVDSSASEAVAPSTEQETPPPEWDLPPLPKMATAPPDLTLPPMPETAPEPTSVEAEQFETPAKAQDASIAAQAAAPPVLDTPIVTGRSAAAEPGLSSRDRRDHAVWQGALSAHLARHARFPRTVRDTGKDRQATVRFSLDARGVVQSVTLVESAGSEVLDAEALALVRRASPMPVPPTVVSSEALDLIVPIRFRAQR